MGEFDQVMDEEEEGFGGRVEVGEGHCAFVFLPVPAEKIAFCPGIGFDFPDEDMVDISKMVKRLEKCQDELTDDQMAVLLYVKENGTRVPDETWSEFEDLYDRFYP